MVFDVTIKTELGFVPFLFKHDPSVAIQLFHQQLCCIVLPCSYVLLQLGDLLLHLHFLSNTKYCVMVKFIVQL